MIFLKRQPLISSVGVKLKPSLKFVISGCAGKIQKKEGIFSFISLKFHTPIKRKMSTFNRGPNTFSVPMSMHKEQRDRLINRFYQLGIKEGSILLQGGKSTTRHDTDHEELFRQESYFHYLFGVKEPDFFGAILLENKKSVLFIPRLPDAYKIWLGKIASTEDFKKLYEVDLVYYVDDIIDVLSKETSKTVHVLHGKNSDSGNFHAGVTLDGLDKLNVNRDVLFKELSELRVFKTDKEIELLRYVNKISSDGHTYVMKNAHPHCMEHQLESLFIYHTSYFGGSRHTSYTCICGSGENASILHYGHAGEPNSKQTAPPDMVLLDMGAEYHCYASDITRSWPMKGKFDTLQRNIYQAVWNAQKAVFDAVKPGVCWKDMHTLALKVITTELHALNILKGDLNELIERDLGILFMPHGLGHLMGIDTHDVGGYPEGVEVTNTKRLKNLRCGRLLEERMVVTVEPGIYFNMPVLEDYFKNPEYAPYLNEEEIRKYSTFGGVRIEDDIVITKDGYENLTLVPSKIEEIESILSQNKFLFP